MINNIDLSDDISDLNISNTCNQCLINSRIFTKIKLTIKTLHNIFNSCSD